MIPPPIARRTLLGGPVWLALVGVPVALTGCSGKSAIASPAVSSPDQLAATRLYDVLNALTPRPGAPTGSAQQRVIADHRIQLKTLGTPIGPRATASAAPFTPQRHVRQEADAAQSAVNDVAGVSPAMAVLLTQIAVSCGASSDVLASAYQVDPAATIEAVTPGATSSPSESAAGTDRKNLEATRRALGRLITAEHAVIYGYGVLTASLSSAEVPLAQRAWGLHRSRRERYSQWLRDLNGEVPTAATAYDLQIDGVDLSRTEPGRLAGVLELRMTGQLLSSVADTDDDLRTKLAADAVGAGRRAQAWGVTVPALLGR